MGTFTPRPKRPTYRAGAVLRERERAVLSVVGVSISTMIGAKPYDEDQDFDAEALNFDTVEVRVNNRTTLRLTQLTVPELTALRDTFLDSVDLAMPICAELDRVAQVAAESGDDEGIPLLRAYRAAPAYIIRERISPRSPA